jgi:translation initiation factor IF-1
LEDSEDDHYMKVEGRITEDLGKGLYAVDLDNGLDIIAHVAGTLRRNSIRILLSDRVKVELSIYDLDKGRIIQRFGREQKQPELLIG